MRNQMLNAELTIVRPRVYVSFVDNLSAEVVHGVFEFADEEQHGGTIARYCDRGDRICDSLNTPFYTIRVRAERLSGSQGCTQIA